MGRRKTLVRVDQSVTVYVLAMSRWGTVVPRWTKCDGNVGGSQQRRCLKEGLVDRNHCSYTHVFSELNLNHIHKLYAWHAYDGSP